MSEHEELDLNLDDLDALGLQEWDPARNLTSIEATAAYLSDVLAEGDLNLFCSALNDVARSEGMALIAERAGVTREGLYKALRAGSKPRFETIQLVLNALGLGMQVFALNKVPVNLQGNSGINYAPFHAPRPSFTHVGIMSHYVKMLPMVELAGANNSMLFNASINSAPYGFDISVDEEITPAPAHSNLKVIGSPIARSADVDTIDYGNAVVKGDYAEPVVEFKDILSGRHCLPA